MSMRFALAIIPALAIGTAACGKKEPKPEPTTAPPAETKPAEADVAAPAPDAAAATPDAAAAAPDAAAANADAAAAAPDAAAANADAAANTDAAAANADAAANTDAAAAAADAAAAPAGPAAVWTAEGFATPESVLVAGDVYYVSNINGAPLDKDDNGFISKLGADGKIIELKWIDGSKPDFELNAPKGSVIVGDVLFVADIDHVRKFDVKTGASLGAIAVPNATFLNDVAAGKDGKTIYVSDSAIGPDFKPKGTAAIYAIVGDEAPKALDIAAIGLPNGVSVEVVADADFVLYNGFDEAKAIHRFDPATKAATTIAVPAGQLDGLAIVVDGDVTWWFVSSWETGSVYKIDKDAKATVLASGIKGPADFGVDVAKKVVVVPMFMENKVAAFAL